MEHGLNGNERQLLYPIFKWTLPYDKIVCKINTGNVGGVNNSITPTGTPYFSRNVYCADFSADSVSMETKWVFVHEMTHVWQYYHRINVLMSAVGLTIVTLGKYENGYPYNLRPVKKFDSFNIEQQASIVGDYYALTQSGATLYNKDPNPSIVEYFDLIAQLRHSGPPHTPSNADYDGIP
jgi:hypothetical protein